MYKEPDELANEQNYRLRRQEALREARETASRSSYRTEDRSMAEISGNAVSSLKNLIKKTELDDIILIGLFFIILDEGLEENIIILSLIVILFFID